MNPLDNPDGFHRHIVRLARNEDGKTYDVVLDCGHEQTWMSWPFSQQIYCADCLQALVDEEMRRGRPL